jgi:lysophospholipid acyltransferase (LPLAT)-like uncharacterized protein
VHSSPALPVRRRLKKAGVRLLTILAPLLYLAYMRLVAATSRIHRTEIDAVFDRAYDDVNVALAILHQDVFVAPFLFRDRAILTLANIGDAGDIITSLLERCGFQVARGGTSSRKSRRTTAVIRDVLRRAEQTPPGTGMITAFTPDGSRGPAGAVRAGVVLLTSKLGAELYCMNVFATRALYLPTWDRTLIPLPFCELWIDVDGPIRYPARLDRDQLEAGRREIENRLHELHRKGFARTGSRPVPPLTPLAEAEDGPEAATF